MADETSIDALRHDMAASEDARPLRLDLRLLRGLVEEIDLDAEEKAFLLDRRKTLEDAFYSEALYALLRKWVSPPQARRLWNDILAHRDHLGARLGRNPGLIVSTVDFLHNVEGDAWELRLVENGAFDFLLADANRDSLTMLHDRDTFMAALEREVDRARRYHRHLALNLVEIDRFVDVTAERGRIYGDFVLRELAGILERLLRSSDLSCRFRGEQFMLMLPESNVQRAYLTAERVRRQVEANAFAMREGQEPAQLTLSGGVAEYPIHGRDCQTLLESAEAALQLAQEGGGNRVCLPPRVVLGA